MTSTVIIKFTSEVKKAYLTDHRLAMYQTDLLFCMGTFGLHTDPGRFQLPCQESICRHICVSHLVKGEFHTPFVCPCFDSLYANLLQQKLAQTRNHSVC